MRLRFQAWPSGQETIPLNFSFDRAIGFPAVRVSPKTGVIGPGAERVRAWWVAAWPYYDMELDMTGSRKILIHHGLVLE